MRRGLRLEPAEPAEAKADDRLASFPQNNERVELGLSLSRRRSGTPRSLGVSTLGLSSLRTGVTPPGLVAR